MGKSIILERKEGEKSDGFLDQELILFGPGDGETAQRLRSAMSAEFEVSTPKTSLDFMRTIAESKGRFACVILDMTAGHGRNPELVLKDAIRHLDARPEGPSAKLVVLSETMDQAVAIQESFRRVDRSIVRPESWGDIYAATANALTVRDEISWENLSPIQRGLLKQTRRNIAKLQESTAQGAALEQDTLAEISGQLIRAASGGELIGAMDALRSHHADTFGHSLKVAGWMTTFGMHLGFRKTDMEVVAQGGLCHDLGKWVVPNEILSSPNRLSPEELEIMRRHPDGARVTLEKTDWLSFPVRACMEMHHEKLDGTGYPYGLKGAEIHELALICAIADVFSALTERRSYKPAMSKQKAFNIMDEMVANGHLDGPLLEKFKEVAS
ncbi:MAG: HD domain-containing phosphohydrolase [Alphaproteobacteria bacterium]|nr:HD domain-containing phosphohydrolase [Alphaproteobacteria bacterium]